MNVSPVGKNDCSIHSVNKELKDIDAEVRQGYREMAEVKGQLNGIIKSYKYLLQGVDKVKLEDAVKGEIQVLTKYEQMQQ